MQMLKNWNPEQIPEKEDIKSAFKCCKNQII